MASETCGLEQISLESFKSWSTDALKSFLRVRKIITKELLNNLLQGVCWLASYMLARRVALLSNSHKKQFEVGNDTSFFLLALVLSVSVFIVYFFYDPKSAIMTFFITHENDDSA